MPLALVSEWLAESYRAIAPKKLVAAMASAGAGVTQPPAAKKTATATKARAVKARPAKKTRPATKARPTKKSRRR